MCSLDGAFPSTLSVSILRLVYALMQITLLLLTTLTASLAVAREQRLELLRKDKDQFEEKVIYHCGET